MGLTIRLSAPRWEIQLAVLTQLDLRPVLIRWSNAEERGFMARFLCFVLRGGADRRARTAS